MMLAFLTRLTILLMGMLVLILHVLQRLTSMVALRVVRGAEKLVTWLVIRMSFHLTAVRAGH